MKRRFLELVYVRWIDSETEDGWGPLSDCFAPFQFNHSVSYLVGQNADMYVLAADYDPESDHFNRVIRIPKDAVRKLRVVTIIPLKQA